MGEHVGANEVGGGRGAHDSSQSFVGAANESSLVVDAEHPDVDSIE